MIATARRQRLSTSTAISDEEDTRASKQIFEQALCAGLHQLTRTTPIDQQCFTALQWLCDDWVSSSHHMQASDTKSNSTLFYQSLHQLTRTTPIDQQCFTALQWLCDDWVSGCHHMQASDTKFNSTLFYQTHHHNISHHDCLLKPSFSQAIYRDTPDPLAHPCNKKHFRPTEQNQNQSKACLQSQSWSITISELTNNISTWRPPLVTTTTVATKIIRPPL